MDYLDLTLPTPAENLALDEALLLEAEHGNAGEALRFWELSDYAVILGSASRLAQEIDEAACQAEGVPLLRRCSGGSTVLLGPGCLAFSLVLHMEQRGLQDVTGSYCEIMNRVGRALDEAAPGLTCAGTSDLALRGRKVSGNSQRRKRSFLLHHGTLLLNFDLSRMSRYLRLPARQPTYRQHRDHAAFVTNLLLSSVLVKERLRAEWGADRPRADWSDQLVKELVAEKYANPAWTRRR